MKITILPSDKGDCLLIETRDGVNILADGGMPNSYKGEVRGFLGDWAAQGRKLDLVYVSHVDQDHIAGVLQLLEDTVLWRVHKHKLNAGKPTTAPNFKEPPQVDRIWHNAFKRMVPDNPGAITTMLAARANTLSSSANPAALKLASAYRNIANSIPEAIKVSRRIAADQLNIPLNGEFGGLLAMVRPDDPVIQLNPGGALEIRVLGPFEKDLEVLRDYWKAWLSDPDNAKGIDAWLAKNGQTLGSVGLRRDEDLGHRDNVTEPNLASLMLLLEETQANGDVVQVLMTGDGHHEDILAGLKHHGRLVDGAGLHVDVLKIQHHGSEHNLDRAFVKTITADHYIFCGNGMDENPDRDVLRVLLDSRLGTPDQLSANAEARDPFTVWLSCSSAYMQRKIDKMIADGDTPGTKLTDAHHHMERLEADLVARQAGPGGARLTVKTLDVPPLTLQL
jgi:hypothetical protein